MVNLQSLDDNQKRAYEFNGILFEMGIAKDCDLIRKIFIAGGLEFSPSNGKIANWRLLRKNSPIFKEEYFNCFKKGLVELGLNKVINKNC